MILVGAQQTASEVERRVIANSALRVVGRLDAAEAARPEYGFLPEAHRRRATIAKPGTMFVSQPEIPVPLVVEFPFPAWATRPSETTSALGHVGPGHRRRVRRAAEMRLLHTSDWHLGKVLKGVDRLPEQRAVLAEIVGHRRGRGRRPGAWWPATCSSRRRRRPRPQRLVFETLLALRATGADVVVDRRQPRQRRRLRGGAAGVRRGRHHRRSVARAARRRWRRRVRRRPHRRAGAGGAAAVPLAARHRAGGRPLRPATRPTANDRTPSGWPASSARSDRRVRRRRRQHGRRPRHRHRRPLRRRRAGGADHLRLPRAGRRLPGRRPTSPSATSTAPRRSSPGARRGTRAHPSPSTSARRRRRRRCWWSTPRPGAPARVRRAELHGAAPAAHPVRHGRRAGRRRTDAGDALLRVDRHRAGARRAWPTRCGRCCPTPSTSRWRRPRRAARTGAGRRGGRAAPPPSCSTSTSPSGTSTTRRRGAVRRAPRRRRQRGWRLMRPCGSRLRGFGAFRDADRGRLHRHRRVRARRSDRLGQVDGDRRHLLRPLRQRAPPRREGGRRRRVGRRQRGRRRADLRERRRAVRRGAGRAPQRTDGRATTKEARLERHGADGRSRSWPGRRASSGRAVEQLLGLGFDHFTRCVVLPQGEFARFLHDKPADRQALLERLLGLGLYDVLVKQANQRAAEAQAAADLAERALDDLPAGRRRVRAAPPAARLRRRRDARWPTWPAPSPSSTACGRPRPAPPSRPGPTPLWPGPWTPSWCRRRWPSWGSGWPKGGPRSPGPTSPTPTRSLAWRAATARLAARRRSARWRRPPRPTSASARATPCASSAPRWRRRPSGPRRRRHRRRCRRAGRGRRAAPALDTARAAHAAHDLAGHLVAGEACPVCQQVVVTVPRRTRTPALRAAEEGVMAAERAKRAARLRRRRRRPTPPIRPPPSWPGSTPRSPALLEQVADHPDPEALVRCWPRSPRHRHGRGRDRGQEAAVTEAALAAARLRRGPARGGARPRHRRLPRPARRRRGAAALRRRAATSPSPGRRWRCGPVGSRPVVEARARQAPTTRWPPGPSTPGCTAR